MSEVENLDGRIVERDASGKFVKVTLDPETARSMAKARAPNKARDTTSITLLEEAGYTNKNYNGFRTRCKLTNRHGLTKLINQQLKHVRRGVQNF
jgi:hypothetical protein